MISGGRISNIRIGLSGHFGYLNNGNTHDETYSKFTELIRLHDKENQKVIYISKHGTIVYEPLDWLAATTSHIPNKYSQSVHFYGFYSNKSRGLRIKAQEKFQANQGNATICSVTPPNKKACSKKWAPAY